MLRSLAQRGPRPNVQPQCHTAADRRRAADAAQARAALARLSLALTPLIYLNASDCLSCPPGSDNQHDPRRRMLFACPSSLRLVLFTALHQALGTDPGPVTSQLLDDAVDQGVSEADGLDWKSEAPSERDLARSDLVKDIAAFANSGGGILVLGVAEEEGRANGRLDVGDIDEGYERTLRRVAISGIHPPVFGLQVHRVDQDPKRRALAIVVPASSDAPHLIYRGEYFGAPIRNHADTEWMRERQLEDLYRLRLSQRANTDRVIDELYDELADGPTDKFATLVIAAQPRGHRVTSLAPDKYAAEQAGRSARNLAATWRSGPPRRRPFEVLDVQDPRRRMRRWEFLGNSEATAPQWGDAWMSLHDNGAVSLKYALGGHRVNADVSASGSHVRADFLELAIADFMGLLRVAAARSGLTEPYTTVLGIEWSGTAALGIAWTDRSGSEYSPPIPLPRFRKIRTEVRVDVTDDVFADQVSELALDALNQGGLQDLTVLRARKSSS